MGNSPASIVSDVAGNLPPAVRSSDRGTVGVSDQREFTGSV